MRQLLQPEQFDLELSAPGRRLTLEQVGDRAAQRRREIVDEPVLRLDLAILQLGQIRRRPTDHPAQLREREPEAAAGRADAPAEDQGVVLRHQNLQAERKSATSSRF